MSGNLYIEPCQRKKKSLSKDLMYSLRKNKNLPIIVDECDISYFHGLSDAGIEDAETIIHYINKYGRCEITIEY